MNFTLDDIPPAEVSAARARLPEIEAEEVVEDNYVFIRPTRLARFESLLR